MTFTELYSKVVEGVVLAIGYLTSSDKRIFIPFLISSLILAFWVYWKSNRSEGFLKYIFNKRVWFSKSALVDYTFLLFNGVFKVLFIAPFLIGALYLSFYTKEFLLSLFGYLDLNLPSWFLIASYTIVLFLAKDFATYVVHYLMHSVPLLWRFHKVHHSAEVLNPITQYRIHPVELLINNIKGLFVFGLVTGVFDYLANGTLQVWGVFGVNIFGFLFLSLGANLRHSHVKLSYPHWVERYVISPVQHQIHHSDNPNHFNKNLGSVLSIWDKWMSTVVYSNEVSGMRFGLGKREQENYRGFWQNLLSPLKFWK